MYYFSFRWKMLRTLNHVLIKKAESRQIFEFLIVGLPFKRGSTFRGGLSFAIRSLLWFWVFFNQIPVAPYNMIGSFKTLRS